MGAYPVSAMNCRGETHTDRVATAPLSRSTVATTATARPSIVNSREYQRTFQPPGAGRTSAEWYVISSNRLRWSAGRYEARRAPSSVVTGPGAGSDHGNSSVRLTARTPRKR